MIDRRFFIKDRVEIHISHWLEGTEGIGKRLGESPVSGTPPSRPWGFNHSPQDPFHSQPELQESAHEHPAMDVPDFLRSEPGHVPLAGFPSGTPPTSLTPQLESPSFLPRVGTSGSQSYRQPRNGDTWQNWVVNIRASWGTLTTPARNEWIPKRDLKKHESESRSALTFQEIPNNGTP